MLKAGLAICVGFFVFGCGSPETSKPPVTEKAEKEELPQSRDLLKEYERYVSSLDTVKEQSVTLATQKYVELFSKSDGKLCDSAFVVFHKLYEKIELNLNTTVYDDAVSEELTCGMTDDNGNEIPPDQRLVSLEKRMKKHGFRVECWEGYAGIAGERAFIATHFYPYISPVMKEYLEGLRNERDHLLGMDAGISVSEAAYVKRLVWWDEFNRKHPDFILAKRAKSTQMYLFTYFLIGMDNTPAINYQVDENDVERMELDAYFVKAYAYLNKKYPASPINALVKTYAAAVQKNDKIKKEKLIDSYTKRGLMIDFSKDFDWNF